MRSIKYIIIHCSATKSNIRFDAKQCKEYHMYVRHYQDIGYHWYIERDGKIVKGRPEGISGAHCAGHNHNSIGVCYEGGLKTRTLSNSPLKGENRTLSGSPSKGENLLHTGGLVPADTRTEAQKRSLLSLLSKLKSRYPNAKIVGHHDFNPHKACPCFDAATEYREL